MFMAEVRLNGSRPLSFLVDTGASSGTFVNRALLGELGLREEAPKGMANPGGEVQVGRIAHVRLQSGDLLLEDQTLLTAPLSSFEPILGRHLDGILGHAFLSQFVVHLDYVTPGITLLDRAPSDGLVLPLVVIDDMPFIEVILENGGRSTPARVEIDSGSFEALGLNGRFVTNTNLIDASARKFEERGVGFGGETKGYRARLAGLRLGSFLLHNPAINVTTDAGGYESKTASAGVLGAEVLRHFDVVIDYPAHRVVLRPNRFFDDAWIEDNSGLRLIATGTAFEKKVIAGVPAASPAAEAGLREGDVLVSVDGVAAAGRPLVEVYQMLRGVTPRQLVLEREGKRIEATLKIRPLV
jgi:Aspartyl protease/PDZ domain